MEVNESLTSGQFIINLINTCIGIGILAQPFAFAISGIYAIISITMAYILVTYAGYCIAKVTMYAYNLDPKPISNIEHEKIEMNDDTDIEVTDIDDTDIDTDIDTPISIQALDTEEGGAGDVELTEKTLNGNQKTRKNIKYSKLPSSSKSEIERESVSKDKNKKKDKPKSVYAEISYKALGKIGEIYGSFGMIFLFTTFLVNILVMNWELLLNIIHLYNPNFNQDLVYLFIILLVIPLLFVLNWKQLTIVGAIGVLSVTITTIIIFYLFVMSQINFSSTKGTIPKEYFDDIDEQNTAKGSIDNMHIVQLIFFSFVTFINSVSGSASIPMMVISSKKKDLRYFLKLIIISYLVVSGFYIIVGLSGKQIYGINTHALILNNFFYWPSNKIISILISIIMIINLCGSYGMFMNIDCDIIEGYLNIKSIQKWRRIILRIILWIATCIIGYFARKNLAFLIAVQGCIDSICGPALPMPFLLYLGIFWKKINIFSKIIHIGLFLFVVSIAISTTIGAIQALT